MKPRSLFFLVALLTLVSLASSRLSNEGTVKPGKCPVVLMWYSSINPPKKCENDGQCHGQKKCCLNSSEKRCINPLREKPGKCAPVLTRCLILFQTISCEDDAFCPGIMKCCMCAMGKICTSPFPE
ncbi:WAP four-disulfide core domain protein 18-like isoform X2 [Macrotis lagotis]|uniref:WAP four-disulfide core domain protein 18-like isoform X2 n=1 Tax=Macrotis lagotis TaxID=92651 RepID=UPI003D68DAE3